MTRRRLLSLLAALPLVGRFVPKRFFGFDTLMNPRFSAEEITRVVGEQLRFELTVQEVGPGAEVNALFQVSVDGVNWLPCDRIPDGYAYLVNGQPWESAPLTPDDIVWAKEEIARIASDETQHETASGDAVTLIRRLLRAYFRWIAPVARERNADIIAGISAEQLARWRIIP